ncbi:MAG: homoserine O-acetyltransferase, partial [Actinomycetota bacterium]
MTRHDYPATGAWDATQPLGSRRFAHFPADRPFALDGAVNLTDVTIAYETWGTLTAERDNAILVCHAWTGDSHAAGPAEDGHPSPGWWEGIIGPGLAIDTNRWFVVCTNVIGGCQGTTGPASPHPVDGKPYGSR